MIPQQGFIITDGMKVTNRNGPILKRVAPLILESQHRMVWSSYCGCTGLPATGNCRTRQHYTDSAGLAKAIVKYQDPSSGTWYQVTDQGAREGNYLESSATALFIYTLAKAINKGYIGNEYIEPTQKAFDGMVKTFTRLEEDGSYTITNCCAVAGLGGDSKRYRDGSFEYYISEPIIENDPKSVGSFILAAIEYEKMTKK